MAKEQTQTQQTEAQAVAPIKLTAKILLRNYTKEDTKEVIDYVSVELPDPFLDPDFVDVAIEPKWRDVNSVFRFYAKKALRNAPEIEFSIEIKVLSYLNKAKKKVYYPGIVGVSPFNGRELEFRVKGENNQAIFDELARKHFGLRKDPDELDD